MNYLIFQMLGCNSRCKQKFTVTQPAVIYLLVTNNLLTIVDISMFSALIIDLIYSSSNYNIPRKPKIVIPSLY